MVQLPDWDLRTNKRRHVAQVLRNEGRTYRTALWLPGKDMVDVREALKTGIIDKDTKNLFIERDAGYCAVIAGQIPEFGLHVQPELIQGDLEKQTSRITRALAGRKLEFAFIDLTGFLDEPLVLFLSYGLQPLLSQDARLVFSFPIVPRRGGNFIDAFRQVGGRFFLPYFEPWRQALLAELEGVCRLIRPLDEERWWQDTRLGEDTLANVEVTVCAFDKTRLRVVYGDCYRDSPCNMEIIAFQKDGEPSQADRIYRGDIICKTVMYLRRQATWHPTCDLAAIRKQARQAKTPGEKAFVDTRIADVLFQHHLRGRQPENLAELLAIRRTLHL